MSGELGNGTASAARRYACSCGLAFPGVVSFAAHRREVHHTLPTATFPGVGSGARDACRGDRVQTQVTADDRFVVVPEFADTPAPLRRRDSRPRPGARGRQTARSERRFCELPGLEGAVWPLHGCGKPGHGRFDLRIGEPGDDLLGGLPLVWNRLAARHEAAPSRGSYVRRIRYRETVSIYRDGDPRCCPSGGTKTRVWHWNGSRFVAGPSKHMTSGEGGAQTPLRFDSPSRNINCWVYDGGSRATTAAV